MQQAESVFPYERGVWRCGRQLRQLAKKVGMDKDMVGKVGKVGKCVGVGLVCWRRLRGRASDCCVCVGPIMKPRLPIGGVFMHRNSPLDSGIIICITICTEKTTKWNYLTLYQSPHICQVQIAYSQPYSYMPRTMAQASNGGRSSCIITSHTIPRSPNCALRSGTPVLSTYLKQSQV